MAGQGRFVFGVLGPNGQRLAFTVIFEYQLPISSRADILCVGGALARAGQHPLWPELQREAARRDARVHQAGRGARGG